MREKTATTTAKFVYCCNWLLFKLLLCCLADADFPFCYTDSRGIFFTKKNDVEKRLSIFRERGDRQIFEKLTARRRSVGYSRANLERRMRLKGGGNGRRSVYTNITLSRRPDCCLCAVRAMRFFAKKCQFFFFYSSCRYFLSLFSSCWK